MTVGKSPGKPSIIDDTEITTTNANVKEDVSETTAEAKGGYRNIVSWCLSQIIVLLLKLQQYLSITF